MEDYVAWQFTKTGSFSVRPAYYAEWEDQYGAKIGSNGGQSSSLNHPVWKKIWRLKMPCKVKIFIWRCLHNSIPFRSTLANRHIPINDECPWCQGAAEDVRHVMFTCSRAKMIWRELGLNEIIDEAALVDRSGAAVLEFLLCDT